MILVYFVKYSLSLYIVNMCEYIGKYFDIIGEDYFLIKGFLNYKNFYLFKKEEYKVVMLWVFLKKFYNLGYFLVDDEIYDLMDLWKLIGNEKGIVVFFFDLDEGLFSLFEF